MVVAVTFSAAALLSGCPLDSSSSGTGGGIDMEIGVDYAVKDGDRLVSTSLPQASIEVIHDFGSETRYAVLHDGTATLFRGQ